MVDDFMVCVDRIIVSACFQPPSHLTTTSDGVISAAAAVSPSSSVVDGGGGGGGGGGGVGEAIECRICQEEGKESDMEAPLRVQWNPKAVSLFIVDYLVVLYAFAHRKCIQRWCNKKGDITCEICNQVYAPNYTVPPTRTQSDGMAIDIRQGWGPRFDLHDPHFFAMAAAEQQLLHAEYDDYAVASNSSIACCRTVTLILMLLLLIRHAVLVVKDPVAPFLRDLIISTILKAKVSILQFAGFLLPCYVMARVTKNQGFDGCAFERGFQKPVI
ncbi:hypothetical protein QJS10_CPB18g00390 [Acorus calamus]|uniref:RING-CH-type domain-containing protein n=1 Tax=Acorus calamus TaxID=4465 RepID=A0AAV9CN66_ACOCL|nr:hypothetical protein QJS10_CPB18g00390 [Acorus calamus]